MQIIIIPDYLFISQNLSKVFSILKAGMSSMRHLSEYQSFQCILWSHEAKIAQHSLVDTVGEFLILKEVRSFASFLNVLHQITTDGKFKSVSYSEFGRLAPQIRQLCLFSFPNSKRLQLSEKIIHSSCSPTFLSSVRL